MKQQEDKGHSKR
jgi:hypothetical protein